MHSTAKKAICPTRVIAVCPTKELSEDSSAHAIKPTTSMDTSKALSENKSPDDESVAGSAWEQRPSLLARVVDSGRHFVEGRVEHVDDEVHQEDVEVAARCQDPIVGWSPLLNVPGMPSAASVARSVYVCQVPTPGAQRVDNIEAAVGEYMAAGVSGPLGRDNEEIVVETFGDGAAGPCMLGGDDSHAGTPSVGPKWRPHRVRTTGRVSKLRSPYNLVATAGSEAPEDTEREYDHLPTLSREERAFRAAFKHLVAVQDLDLDFGSRASSLTRRVVYSSDMQSTGTVVEQEFVYHRRRASYNAVLGAGISLIQASRALAQASSA